jgi:NADH:ubiquinone oxidoreductase subunit E
MPGRQEAISRKIRRRAANPSTLIEVLHQVQLLEGYLAAGALHQAPAIASPSATAAGL